MSSVREVCRANRVIVSRAAPGSQRTLQLLSKMATEAPPTPNPSTIGEAQTGTYHRIKTPKLTGKLHHTQWSHAQSYGESETAPPEWLSEKERTTVIRSVPKLKIHEDQFEQSPRSAMLVLE